MELNVFFSWQSDTPVASGRTFIERALIHAAGAIAADTSIPFRPEVDQDTRGVPGAPAMVAAILAKIDVCSVFVGDVSLTCERLGGGRRSPNPNVLVELGYALRRVGSERVLLILDSTTGRPDDLPFDLRGNRVIAYDSSAEETVVLDALSGELEAGLRLILTTVGPPAHIAPPVHLELQFDKVRIEGDRHDYRLRVTASNRGSAILRDWVVDVRIPRALLNPQRSYPIVQAPITDGRVTLRITEANHSGPIYPGEPKEVMGIDYIMTHELYERRAQLFQERVEAVLYVDGEQSATASRSVRDLQCF